MANGKLAFWRRWLLLACLAVQAFGALMFAAPGLTKGFFGLVLFAEPTAIGQFPAPAVGYIELVHAVLGAVLFGWGVALFLVVRWFFLASPAKVAGLLAASLLCWAVPDTAFSLWSGFWQNAVLNLGFVVLFAIPLIALRRWPRGEPH